MIASTQIANTESFAFIAVLVFHLLSRKVVFINRKSNRNYYKVGCFLRKWQISRVNYCKIINSWNAKFSGYFWNTKTIIYHCFFNLHDCTFNPDKAELFEGNFSLGGILGLRPSNGYFSFLYKELEKQLWNSFLLYMLVKILQLVMK